MLEFVANGDFSGGVVEHVGRAFGEEVVALRVGVGSATLRVATASQARKALDVLKVTLRAGAAGRRPTLL